MNEKIKRWLEEYEARREELRQWKLECKHLVDVMRTTKPVHKWDEPDWFYLIELFDTDGILSRKEYAKAWAMMRPEDKMAVTRLDYFAGLITDEDYQKAMDYYESQKRFMEQVQNYFEKQA